MKDHTNWPGLTREKLEEIGNRYEAACLIAMERAKKNHPVDASAMAKQMVELRRGIRIAVMDELQALGCPAEQAEKELQTVIDHQTKFRMAEGRKQDAKGRSGALH